MHVMANEKVSPQSDFGVFRMRTTNRANQLVVLAGICFGQQAIAQVSQEPIGAVLRYEVAVPNGTWTSYLNANPGDRVEWRAVLSFTGTQNAVALGRIYYQPVISGADNSGSGSNIDRLGDWRSAGVSGQGTVPLAQGLLSAEEGNSSAPLASYGRVHYGFTSRSTTAGSSGALTGIRHSSDGGSPAGSFIRVAGSNNVNWYPSSIPNGTVQLNNQILWGVVSDNNTAASTWYATGTQNLVLLRQALILSPERGLNNDMILTISSEAATLQRAGGSSGTDDTRFMTWALQGEGGSTASIRVGVQYVPATINLFIPSPGTLGVIALCGVFAAKRRRGGGDVTTERKSVGGDQ